MLQWQQLNLKKDLEYALMATRCWIFMGKYLKSLSICKSSSSLLLERSLRLYRRAQCCIFPKRVNSDPKKLCNLHTLSIDLMGPGISRKRWSTIHIGPKKLIFKSFKSDQLPVSSVNKTTFIRVYFTQSMF